MFKLFFAQCPVKVTRKLKHVWLPDNQNRTLYRRTVNKTTWNNLRYNMELFYFSVWVFESMWTRVYPRVSSTQRESISRSIFNATRTGNGFNKIMRNGNGFTKVIMFIIWLAPRAGKMNQITRCDWLPKRARGSHLARLGLSAVSRKQNFPKSHIINPLLTKFIRSSLYWPSLFAQDDWILASFFFCEFIDLDFVSVHKHAKKELGQYPAILTSHLVNNPYIFISPLPAEKGNTAWSN